MKVESPFGVIFHNTNHGQGVAKDPLVAGVTPRLPFCWGILLKEVFEWDAK